MARKMTSDAGRAFSGVNNPMAHMGAALARRHSLQPQAASVKNAPAFTRKLGR